MIDFIHAGARTAAIGAGSVFAVDHRGWRSCRMMRGRCCACAKPWSTSTAAYSARCRGGSTLDIDDTFDAVHGGLQLRLFNAHYDDYGLQPIVVFDQDGRFVTAILRPAKRPNGVEIRAFLRRLVRAIRFNWPNVRILVGADSHYACPEVLDWCEANGLEVLEAVVVGSPKNDYRLRYGIEEI